MNKPNKKPARRMSKTRVRKLLRAIGRKVRAGQLRVYNPDRS